MRETPEDIFRLQQLIEQSNDHAGPFLRSSFEIPDKTLSAEQLVRALEGVKTLVLATVTSDGRPISAPVVAIFYRGSFCIPTVSSALRARHVRSNPSVSLSLYEGNDFAVIAHGNATLLGPDEKEFQEMVELQVEHSAGDVRTWGDDPMFVRVAAEKLYSFARYPVRFPG